MLPDDILFLICEQLRLVSDFNTLFTCALTSKHFAAAALPNLWRIHDTAPCSSNGPDDVTDLPKWMKLWRTLILSSFPETTYTNYLQYIRVLSLRDLEFLFDEGDFRSSGKKNFFKDQLSEFYAPLKKVENIPRYRFAEWSAAISIVIASIGDRITKHCADLAAYGGRKSVLEELDCGRLPADAIQRYILRISALRSLRLWNGSSLTSSGPLIRDNCPRFSEIYFYEWNNPDADESFAGFLRDVKPHSLRFLEVFGSSIAKELTASALSEHNTALTDLKIKSAESEFLGSLPLLGPCLQLKTLHFDLRPGNPPISLDSCHEISTWLSSCTNISDLAISHSQGTLASDILTSVLYSQVQLVKLDVGNYTGGSAAGFHRALAEQSNTLEYLTLLGDPDDSDNDILVASLSKLTKLRDLQLRNISNYFSNGHISSLAHSLPDLEEFYVSGWNIVDAIWPALSALRKLRKLDLNAYSSFTLRGILAYIDTLGPGNTGLALNIMMADPSALLFETEQEIVREALVAKVDGRFDYMPGRDPNAESDSESDSD